MLLCDRIARAGPCEADVSGAPTTAMPVAGSTIASLVRRCPVRYVLNEDVYEHCRRMAVAEVGCVQAALPDIRFAHPLMWLEWREPIDDNGHRRRRAGILVESDGEGRSGRFSSAWIEEWGGPFRSPAYFVFDFDRQISNGLAAYGVDPCNGPLYGAYDQLFRHADFKADGPWLGRLMRQSRSSGAHRSFLRAFFQGNFRDFALLCAFQLLLSLPRMFERRPSSLSRLNTARKKRNAPPLLDHVELTMNLGALTAESAGALETRRTSPRLHWVRGHVVRRNGADFWRRSHVRGEAAEGVIATRTMHVAIGSASARPANGEHSKGRRKG